MWRFDPPNYYKHLHCSREGTLDVAYTCLNGKGQLTCGFVRPQCRKAEYCVCKPQYHGALCDKVLKWVIHIKVFRIISGYLDHIYS